MSINIAIYLVLMVLCFFERSGMCQTLLTRGKINGRLVDSGGRSVRGIVGLQSDTGGSNGSIATSLDGSFSFQNVPAGSYGFCVRVPAETSPTPTRPYLDTCIWEQSQTSVKLAAGQSVSGVQIVVPPGALLVVRVNDPEKLLPPASTTAMGSDLQLQLIVRASNRMVHHLSLQSQDAGGRTYSAIVPAATALSVSAQSPLAKLFDQNGQPIQGEIGVTTVAGGTSMNVQITAHHN